MPTRRSLVLGAAALSAPALAQIRGNLVMGRDGWLFATWEDIRRVNNQRMRPVLQLVNQTVRLLREAEIAVGISLPPTRARLFAEHLPPEFQPNADAQRRYELALEELRRSGAVVPDLLTLFTGLKTSQRDPIFFRADSHWTAMGAEFAANDMARQLREAAPLPASRRPGTRLGNYVTNVHSGDFLALLPEADKPRYPAERFRIRQAAAGAGGGSVEGGLLEDDNSDVVIIGNSYMQPYFSYPQVLSAALNRPVSLVWKTARVGPYKTLLDYVTGSQFRASRPRLLIWHLMEGSLEQMPDNASWWESSSVIPGPQFLSELGRAVRR